MKRLLVIGAAVVLAALAPPVSAASPSSVQCSWSPSSVGLDSASFVTATGLPVGQKFGFYVAITGSHQNSPGPALLPNADGTFTYGFSTYVTRDVYGNPTTFYADSYTAYFLRTKGNLYASCDLRVTH